MSTQPKAVREYHLADSALKQKADGIAVFAFRDISVFTTRGIISSTISSLQLAATQFADIPSDEELIGAVMVATQTKDEKADDLRMNIRTIRTMVANKYGTEDAHYRTYVFDGIDDLSDEELIRLGKRTHRIATTQLTALAAEGLSVPTLAKLSASCNAFDASIENQGTMMTNRDIGTQDRIRKGNALYKEMMRICNHGKDIWISTDEARYNDYVIYDTPSGNAHTPPAPKAPEPPRVEPPVV